MTLPAAFTDGFLRTEELVKRFDNALAVDLVNLSIRKGEIFALLGSSGCGKSTLLRMLAGFEKPSAGSVILNGVNIVAQPPHVRPINMMFQSYALFPHLDVWNNIAFGLKREGIPSPQLSQRVGEMLDLVQMADLARRKPHQLSGGQQQRVALARSLAKRPQLLLLDEPLGALDRKLRERTQFELVNIIESVGVTCVMVTHDQEEAMTMASRIAVMSHGRVVQVGTPHEIYDRPNSRFVADFIGSVNLFEGQLLPSATEFFEVATEAGVLRLAGTCDLPAGHRAAVAVRPEKIYVSSTRPEQDHNVFSATVREIAYFGSYSSFVLELPGGRTVRVTKSASPSASGPAITWNDAVFFWWDAAASRLLTV